ncbi:MAG: calcium-binding protein [Prochloraceae cyanobacterium]
MFGYAVYDLIFGNGGADSLFGNAGSDTLYGNSGNDLLFGGAGNDLLFGGTGNDRFFLDGNSFDLVVDFTSGEDLIQLTGTFSDFSFSSQGTTTNILFNNSLIGIVNGTIDTSAVSVDLVFVA